MAVTTAFRGDFLWVNHVAGSLKAKPHRHEVFTHVQSKYHRWRRVDEARKLGASAKVPRHGSGDKNAAESSEPQQREAVPGNERELVPAASSVLRNGNSDPFNTFPLPVSARFNDLMAFERMYLYPAVHALEMQMTPTNQRFASKWWSETTLFIHDEVAAYGYASRIAAVLATFAPGSEYLRISLMFKSKGSNLLRSHLTKPQNDLAYHQKTGRAAVALLLAEMFAADYFAAGVHIKMLESFFAVQVATAPAQVDLHVLFSVVYQDMQRCALSLSPMIFDVEDSSWLTKQFTPIWMDATSVLPPLTPMAEAGLDASIDYPPLRTFFTSLRELLFVLGMVLTDPASARPSTWFYIMTRVTLVMGALTNHLVNWAAEPHARHVPGRLVPGLTHWVYMQAYASLAALYWARRVGNIECVPVGRKTTIYTAGPVLLARLREALELADSLASQEERDKYARVRLWALHVGATAEQGQVMLNGGQGLTEKAQWFTPQFGKEANRLAIASWEECRGVLMGFLYADVLQPHISMWFSEVTKPIA